MLPKPLDFHIWHEMQIQIFDIKFKLAPDKSKALSLLHPYLQHDSLKHYFVLCAIRFFFLFTYLDGKNSDCLRAT